MRVPKRVLSAAIAAVALTTGVAVASAPAASAAPDCAVAQAPVRVAQIGGTALEGLAVDASGRLYTTDIISGRVFRIDAPGQPAYEVARVPGGGGALAWAPDGTLLVGYGANPTVLIGDVVKAAGIVRLNVDTLETSTFATGLSAANGLAVADDGTVYATNDFGSLIGRIAPDGTVDAAWARFPSANGAVLDETGQYLYVSRTFVNSGVSRIPTSNPSAPESILDLNGLDSLSAPDGLTLDSAGRPVVPFNTRGQIVRIDAPGSYCILGSGIPTSSVVIYGRGEQGFSAGRLFRAGFDGAVYEIPGGRDLN